MLFADFFLYFLFDIVCAKIDNVKTENVEVDFAEGDTVTVIGGVWKDTVGVIQSMNHSKQIVTINVELFGRETPVEISFADVKLAN